jgi:hypothetical protein
MRRWTVGFVVVILFGIGQANVTGEIVFQHVGNAHPVISEGWTEEIRGGGVTAGPVNNDLGLGIDAWYVDDDSTEVYSTLKYVQTPTDAQIADANTYGWKLSTRLRVVDVDRPANLTVGVRYSNGDRRYGMILGSDGDGDPIVILGEGVTEDERLVYGPTFTLEGEGSTYHLYELVFDPVADSASLFVDGTQCLSGYTGVSADTKRVFWGSNNSYTMGHGNYNLVEWEIIPEPSTFVLLSMATLTLTIGWWRRRRAA